jgi:hypothetical protein
MGPLAHTDQLAGRLPGHLRARLPELDLTVSTDRHKHLGFAVLKYKDTNPAAPPPGRLPKLELRPPKLSKFLWATEV